MLSLKKIEIKIRNVEALFHFDLKFNLYKEVVINEFGRSEGQKVNFQV